MEVRLENPTVSARIQEIPSIHMFLERDVPQSLPAIVRLALA
jgi:hypothetical protein